MSVAEGYNSRTELLQGPNSREVEMAKGKGSSGLGWGSSKEPLGAQFPATTQLIGCTGLWAVTAQARVTLRYRIVCKDDT